MEQRCHRTQQGRSVSQGRDAIGQFATAPHSDPELNLTSPAPDAEGLRATLVDFLEGSLPGFNFVVDGVDEPVDALVTVLVAAHISD